MKVVIDNAIPYIQGVLEPFAEVVYRPGASFSAEDVRDADALIIRTRTRCSGELLDSSSVKLIATATIGFDHIDLDYCRDKGIEVVTAAGCNAAGVLQWVSAALAMLAKRDCWQPQQRTLGIVGVGNVGKLVEKYARAWGFNVLRCDPPRKEREGGDFLPIEDVAREADILTLHTPLDATTHHLVDTQLLSIMRPEATIINASRGGVVDNMAVVNSSHRYAFDVWESEPHIDPKTLQQAMLATPHIAGYSLQGKANATSMSINALARHFNLPLTEWRPTEVLPTTPRLLSWEDMCATIERYCDIVSETETLKRSPEHFESLRNDYRYREEYF